MPTHAALFTVLMLLMPVATAADLGPCDGCEAALEAPRARLKPAVVLAPKNEPGERLVLEGTVFRPDGHTPAGGIVLYVHQTDASGRYSRGSGASAWSRRHGLLRGWLMTGPDGRYRIDTVRPGHYPGRRSPAHIHMFIDDGRGAPYWIDDVVFADDPLVDAAYKAQMSMRGGSGIVAATRTQNTAWSAVRNIVLPR